MIIDTIYIPPLVIIDVETIVEDKIKCFAVKILLEFH